MARKVVFFLLLLVLPGNLRAQSSPGNAGNDLIGINLSAIADWSTGHPFVDIFRTARPWISQRDGANWGEGGPLALTPEGWIASLEPGQYAETIMFSGNPALAVGLDGLYTVLYDGEGQIAFRGNNVTIVRADPGLLIVDARPGQGAIFLQVRQTNPRDPLRNIRFLLPGAEGLYAAQPFNPYFLDVISRFKVLRFMDWMGTNGAGIQEWAERPRVTDATYALRGVPVEIMVQLARTVHADVWFNMPHRATDDYVLQFATYVRDNLPPDLKVYIEYSNETWNGQFPQAQYVIEQGKALGLADGDDFLAGLRYYSQRSVEIFTIWESVFGGTERLVRVLASQAANPWTGEQIALWNEAYLHADALAIAPYFSCDDPGNPDTAEATALLTVNELLDRQLTNLQPGGCAHTYITQHVELAKRYQLQPVAYEGGQHLVGYGGAENNDTLTTLFMAANRDIRMGEIYLTYLRTWRDAGGGIFMLYNDIASPTKFGSWGLLEYVTQNPRTAYKYQAVMNFLDEIQQP